MVLPGQAVTGDCRAYLVRGYDRSPAHFLATSSLSIDQVGNTQGTGEYALRGQEETPTTKAHHP